MCSEEQHRQMMVAMKEMHELLVGRPPLDSLIMISSTQPYIIDYRTRKHIFLWTATTLTLLLEDLGQVGATQYTWTNIGFSTGMKIYASGVTNPTAVFIRCTDETVP